MKRKLAVILAVTLMLTGCSAKAKEPAALSTLPTQTEPSTQPTTMPAMESLPQATQMQTISTETQPETVPTPTASVRPTASRETAPAATQTTPKQTRLPAVQTKPQQATITPTKLTVIQTTPPTTKPTSPTPSTYPAATDNSVLMFARNEKTIFVGDTDRLDIFYFGNKKLSWHTSHPYGLTVDQSGNISPRLEGNFKVYVTDGEYTAEALIFAPRVYGAASSVYFDDLRTEMTTGQSKLLNLNGVSPLDYFFYSSSNPAVVKTSGHYITAVSPGTAIVTAKNSYGEAAKIIVTVVPDSATVKLDIREENLALYKSEELQLTGIYTGSGTLEWKTSNTHVAMIDENGLLRATGKGTCSIYLSDGTYADTCELTVTIDPKIKAEKMTFTQDNAPLYDGITKYKGNYMEFEVQVAPYPADAETHITVSDPTVIKLSNTWNMGRKFYRLDFKKAGTCVVNITSGDGALTYSYTVRVKDTYDCNPGKTKLTPGEYAYYATQVAVENGQIASSRLSGYLYLWLSDEDLTWESAIGTGEMQARVNYALNNEYALIVYAGWDASAGKHLFFHGY